MGKGPTKSHKAGRNDKKAKKYKESGKKTANALRRLEKHLKKTPNDPIALDAWKRLKGSPYRPV